MRRAARAATLGLAVLFAFPGPASGQPEMSAAVYVTATSNLFRNHEASSDWITSAYVAYDHVFANGWRLWYSGDADVFKRFGDLMTHSHEVGADFARPLGGSGWAQAWVAVNGRFDRPAYRYEDYFEGRGGASAQFQTRGGARAGLAYRLRYRDYANARTYSALEQVFAANVLRSWQTGTTAAVWGDAGVKSYAIDENPGGAGASGRTVTQVALRWRLAQALAGHTGIRVEGTHRMGGRGGDGLRAAENEADYDDPFEDRYSYRGESIAIVAKHVAKGGLEIEAGFRYERRTYPDRPALDLGGEPIVPDAARHDRRSRTSLEVRRSLSVSGAPFTVSCSYGYLKVNSNDPYYDAAAHVATLGLSADF